MDCRPSIPSNKEGNIYKVILETIERTHKGHIFDLWEQINYKKS